MLFWSRFHNVCVKYIRYKSIQKEINEFVIFIQAYIKKNCNMYIFFMNI